MLARLGGDEFLVLAPQTDRERLQTLAQRIIDRLKTPFRIGLIEVYTGCSIGIALCPEHGNDLDSLIRSADTAMYVAKEHGKRTYTVFSPEMNKRVAEYMWLDTNLRKGTGKISWCCITSRKSTRAAVKCTAWKRWCAGIRRSAA